MRFSEIVTQASDFLQNAGRVSYRALKLEFDLTDEQLEALKEEFIYAKRIAVDEDNRVLVWIGEGETAGALPQPASPSQSPASYTPPHLAERILAEQAAMESRGSADGERKTITALCADLKGSTALIEGLDPEDARAIIDPALQLMMDAVHRYDGYVAQALGDGIFALFGAPIAHEDHPQRALYAALRMQEEMWAYSDQSRLKGGIPLQMRVGINTGEVVVRSIRKDDLHTDYVPVGHSTNLAARMEQIATPGSIVISEYTRKLTEGYFELKALGAAEIKGVEKPLNVYEVLGAGPLRTRLQVAARRGLTRFVGRQSELDQMRQALEQAKAAHGQIVGVMGEPGLGKSRLFYEFKLTSQSGCLILEAFSVSHGKGSPYLPLIELLKTYFQIEPADDERTRKEKLGGKVLMLDRSLEDTLPYLFSLLGIDGPTSSLQQMDAQIRRQRTFEALKKLFLRESLNQPLVLIFEDLHWIDTETQGFLDTLCGSVASANLLLLVNYRPEYRHEWGQKTYYTQLRLAPLGQAEAEELLTFLLGSDTSLTNLKPLILEKTEGTPFFIEEVVQTLVEEGALTGERGQYHLETTPTALHISPTVQGVLAARIDRLTAEEKVLLQQLSVIGRQFPISLVKQVVPQSEPELHRLLSSLQAKEFLYEQPAFPEVEYLFKHALTQEVAYGTVLQEQRKALHECTGQAVEALYAEHLDDHYGELAYHYQRSEDTEKAVTYLGLAGQQAAQRSANTDAMRALSDAWELLPSLPETVARHEQELMILVSLGPLWLSAKGWGTPEAEQVYRRAEEVCRLLDATPQLALVLAGLSNIYLSRADYETGYMFAEQLHQTACTSTDPELQLYDHTALGVICLFRGEFRHAYEQLEKGRTLYDVELHHRLAVPFGLDPGLVCAAYSGIVLWHLGYPDQARQRVHEALGLVPYFTHSMSRTIAPQYAAWSYQLLREGHEALPQAEAAMATAQEAGLPAFMAYSRVLRGAALVQLERAEEGVTELRQGTDEWQAVGTRNSLSYFYLMLADGFRAIGEVAQGLAYVEETLSFVNQTGEGYCEAELQRLKGELLRDTPSESEAAFQQALAVAQKQQAKSWELRAATSLARLWQSQGKTTEACDLLAPIYHWFTEGFDTADLKDAKALLDALT